MSPYRTLFVHSVGMAVSLTYDTDFVEMEKYQSDYVLHRPKNSPFKDASSTHGHDHGRDHGDASDETSFFDQMLGGTLGETEWLETTNRPSRIFHSQHLLIEDCEDEDITISAMDHMAEKELEGGNEGGDEGGDKKRSRDGDDDEDSGRKSRGGNRNSSPRVHGKRSKSLSPKASSASSTPRLIFYLTNTSSTKELEQKIKYLETKTRLNNFVKLSASSPEPSLPPDSKKLKDDLKILKLTGAKHLAKKAMLTSGWSSPETNIDYDESVLMRPGKSPISLKTQFIMVSNSRQLSRVLQRYGHTGSDKPGSSTPGPKTPPRMVVICCDYKLFTRELAPIEIIDTLILEHFHTISSLMAKKCAYRLSAPSLTLYVDVENIHAYVNIQTAFDWSHELSPRTTSASASASPSPHSLWDRILQKKDWHTCEKILGELYTLHRLTLRELTGYEVRLLFCYNIPAAMITSYQKLLKKHRRGVPVTTSHMCERPTNRRPLLTLHQVFELSSLNSNVCQTRIPN